jgi:hypothetical protein
MSWAAGPSSSTRYAASNGGDMTVFGGVGRAFFLSGAEDANGFEAPKSTLFARKLEGTGGRRWFDARSFGADDVTAGWVVAPDGGSSPAERTEGGGARGMRSSSACACATIELRSIADIEDDSGRRGRGAPGGGTTGGPNSRRSTGDIGEATDGRLPRIGGRDGVTGSRLPMDLRIVRESARESRARG